MSEPVPTRVMLADRPGGGRSALATVVAYTSGLTLVAKVSDLDEIADAARQTHPDVVVVDDRLLDDSWSARDLDARLIVVGVDDDPGYPARARRLGAAAWVPKDRADALVSALIG